MLEVCNVWVGADSFRHRDVVSKQQQGGPLSEGEMVQIIDVDQKQEWTQDEALWHSRCNW